MATLEPKFSPLPNTAIEIVCSGLKKRLVLETYFNLRPLTKMLYETFFSTTLVWKVILPFR